MRFKIKTEHSTGRQIVTFGGKKALIRDEWVLICAFDESKKAWIPKTYDIQAILEHFISRGRVETR